MRIGIYPGSFNPIHVGHMVIAGYMAEFAGLDQVWMVVSPRNPLKMTKDMLQDYHRLDLVKLAIGDNRKIKASDVEFKLSKPSYTINTINFLKEKYPAHEFVLIMGEDNLTTFDQWKDYEVLLEHCMLYVYPRLHVEETKFHQHPKVKLIREVPVMEISATFIRNSIRQKKDVQYMLPESAWKHIEEMKFYET
ncbi:nicotinate (nicotinamide) nucleotide adenylyltransferase [soil metagenome]